MCRCAGAGSGPGARVTTHPSVWDALSDPWAVNEAFLQEQMEQGKTFVLTSDPAEATGWLAQEVAFLTEAGYTFGPTDLSPWTSMRS